MIYYTGQWSLVDWQQLTNVSRFFIQFDFLLLDLFAARNDTVFCWNIYKAVMLALLAIQ